MTERSAVENPPEQSKELPRVLMRRFVQRELGSIDAWELALAGRLYPQMWENKRALLLILRLLDALEANPKVAAALGKVAPIPTAEK
jgi:hypothetical protein